MKKNILSILSMAILMVGLVGCSGEDATSETGISSNTPQETIEIEKEAPEAPKEAPEDPMDAIKIIEKTIFTPETSWTGTERVLWLMENTCDIPISIRSEAYVIDEYIPPHKIALVNALLDDETADAPEIFDVEYVESGFYGDLEVIDINSTTFTDNTVTITYTNNDDKDREYIYFEVIFYRDGKPVETALELEPGSDNAIKPGETKTVEIESNVPADDAKAYVAPVYNITPIDY